SESAEAAPVRARCKFTRCKIDGRRNPPYLSSSSPRRRGPSRLQWRKPQIFRQIAPAKVVLLDQLQLPHAPPLLDPLLPQDRVFHRGMLLKPDEALHAILQRKTRHSTLAMCVDALDQVRCDADIQRPVALARKNIDRRLKLALHTQSLL